MGEVSVGNCFKKVDWRQVQPWQRGIKVKGRFCFEQEGADPPSVLDPWTKPGLPTLPAVPGS